jgi:hypothetical protein
MASRLTVSIIHRIAPLALTPSGAPAMDSYRTYDGTDHLGTVGKVAPGLFAQEGRCWRMVYENQSAKGGHCMEPVAWVGRWKF